MVMKEINFLPEWYKSSRRRQISYRTQYVALGGIFVVIMAWNFIATHSISKARAELTRETPRQVEAESASRKFKKIKSEVAELQKKADVLEEIDSKIDVTSVLAEMSFLIDKKIVLSKVEFKAEKFPDKQTGRPSKQAGTAVRVVRDNFRGKEALLLGDVRFKVAMAGVAADSSDVAELVCRLEDSPYFCQVTSSWQNSEISVGAKSVGENYQVSAFEISCYLANYRQEERK